MEPGPDRRDWLAQARRGVLELCVLALIGRQPSYGYELATQLAALGQPLAAPEGTLYPLLRRLQRDGLIAATWQESRDGPPRKYYHLTPAGRPLLHAQLSEWHALTRAVAELSDAAKITDEEDNGVPDGTRPSLSPQPALSGRAPTPADAAART
jgi:PadR family transcriptional regulator PadR